MPTRTFAITADDKPVTLDSQGAGEISITVTNTTSHPIRGQARLMPLGQTKLEWLQLSGEVERNFSANEAHQYVVRMTAPAGTAAGRYSFRLNVVSVQNPDDDFAEGPVVAFELRAAAPTIRATKSKFPWFYVLLALILVGGGIAVALLLSGKKQVPQLVDKTLVEASNTLSQAGLKLAEVSWTNAGTVVPGHVASQLPEAGTKVKANTGVSVVMRKQPPPVRIKVPRVIGQDSIDAVNALVKAQLAVTNLNTVRTTRSSDWNRVVGQSPKPGTEVLAGTPVSLSVGVPQRLLKPITVRALIANPNLLKQTSNPALRHNFLIPKKVVPK